MAMYGDEQGTGLDETYDDTEQVGSRYLPNLGLLSRLKFFYGSGPDYSWFKTMVLAATNKD